MQVIRRWSDRRRYRILAQGEMVLTAAPPSKYELEDGGIKVANDAVFRLRAGDCTVELTRDEMMKLGWFKKTNAYRETRIPRHAPNR